jgi:serine protease Do
MNDLPRLVADTAPGTKASVKVLRDGKEKTFSLTVSELTEERQASEAKEEGGGEKNPLGLLVKNINPELARRFHLRDTKGVLVEGVEPDSAAADAGIQPGDIVMEIDNQAINTVKDFQTAVDRLKKENFARLLIKRQGRTQYLTLEVPK